MSKSILEDDLLRVIHEGLVASYLEQQPGAELYYEGCRAGLIAIIKKLNLYNYREEKKELVENEL